LEAARPKFGVPKENPEDPPFRHPNAYLKQDGRILATVTTSYVDLILSLASRLTSPFEVLYVLIVAEEELEGRYQLSPLRDFDELAGFLNPYRNFFEQDARHDIWVRSEQDQAMIVYDHHDMLCLYGKEELFEEVLLAEGLNPGPCEIPFPHFHNYNHGFDGLLHELLATPGLVKEPLTEHDLG